jgi:hypothetical protein
MAVVAREATLFLGDKVLRGAGLTARKACGSICACQAIARFGAEVAHVGEVGLQPIHTLLVVRGLGVELVIPLDLCGKSPVIEFKGLANHGVEAV